MTDRIAEAARATRKYEVEYYVITRCSRIWHSLDETISVAGPLQDEDAKAACDRLNLLAVLEALREPSEGMEKAALLRYPNLGNGDVASIWYAMIDALIAEVRPETELTKEVEL